MRRIILFIGLVSIVLLSGCGSGGDGGRTLAGLEGTWDYTYHIVMDCVGDGYEGETFDINMSYTITTNGIYDPYFGGWLPWEYEGDTIVYEIEFVWKIEDYDECGDMTFSEHIKISITISPDRNSLVINGFSTVIVTHSSPDPYCEDINCTATYTGTATRRQE